MAARKKYVLALDDDDTIRELYQEQLPILGYEVKTVGTGEALRKALDERLPDILLMDVMMSGEDGIGITKEMRKDPRTAKLPIIVVSGLSDAGTLTDAIHSGADDFLCKPFELENLRMKLDRASAAADKRTNTKTTP